jgi:hypothetical protein
MVMRHLTVLVLLSLTAAFIPTLVRAEEPQLLLKPEYVLRQKSDPPRWVVSVRFWIAQDKKTNIAKSLLVVTNGAPFDAGTYQLLKKADNTSIAVTPVPDLNSGPLISTLDLLPSVPLTAESDYELTIPANKVFVVFPGRHTNTPNQQLKGIIHSTNIQVNLEHGNTNTFHNRLSFLGGTPGGVASLDLTYRTVEFLDIDWLNIDFTAKADFTLSSKDRKEFFNSISGGGSVWYSLPSSSFYSEIGFHDKLESDQAFKLINNLLGVHYAVLPKIRIIDRLSRIFVSNAVDVPPLLIFSYDYAHNVKGDETTVASETKIDTGEADHRLSALLRWRLPIASRYDFSFLPALGGKYDVGIDFELKGTYDSSAERFLDQSWISLDFTRQSSDALKPSFSFTWARGKAGPTFKEINAILAGIKLAF